VPVVTLKVLASLLQLHGPGATIQSDHQGIDAILGDVRDRISGTPAATDVAFRRGAFARGGGGGGAFRRAAGVGGVGYGGGAFRRGAFRRF
jgi:hypothetical protein